MISLRVAFDGIGTYEFKCNSAKNDSQKTKAKHTENKITTEVIMPDEDADRRSQDYTTEQREDHLASFSCFAK